MGKVPTTELIKDDAVVEVELSRVAEFEADGFVAPTKTLTDTTSVGLDFFYGLFSMKQLVEIALEAGVDAPNDITDKAVLIMAICKARGQIAYTTPA